MEIDDENRQQHKSAKIIHYFVFYHLVNQTVTETYYKIQIFIKI